MRGKLLGSLLVLTPAVAASAWWFTAPDEEPTARVQRLLTLPPETIHLATPLWNYTTTQPLDWTQTPLADGWVRYDWSGQIDSDPEVPNLTVRSATQTLTPFSAPDSEGEFEMGYRLEMGIRRRLEILPFGTNQFSAKAYPVHLPSGTCFLTFEAARIQGAAEETRLGWEIEGATEGSLDVVSPDYSRFEVSLSLVEAGTRILRFKPVWEGTLQRSPEFAVRDLWIEAPLRLEVVLPAESATPEIWFRPRDPAPLLLSGSPNLEQGTPAFVSSPWEVYDEDERWVRPVDINGTVRTGVLLPSPSRWSVEIPPGDWNSLVFYPGVQNPFDPATLNNALLRVSLKTPQEDRTLWEDQVGHMDARDSMPPWYFKHVPLSWQNRNPTGSSNQPLWRRGVVVPLSGQVEGEKRTLLFESLFKDSSPAPVPVILGDPLLVPAPRRYQGDSILVDEDLLDGKLFLRQLREAGEGKSSSPAKRTHLLIDWKVRLMAGQMIAEAELEEASRRIILDALNGLIALPDFYIKKHFAGAALAREAAVLVGRGLENLNAEELQYLNRSLLEAGFEGAIRKRPTYNKPASPDVILISLDTLRGDSLSCLGYYRDTTPWMSSYFAPRGVRFTNAEAPSTWTLPSHSGLFLSQFISRHGVRTASERVGALSKTLAERFAEGGYETAAFTDRGFLQHSYGFYQGFETYDQVGGGFGSILPRCERLLEERIGSNPLFLFLHTYDIHDPYHPPQPYFDRFLTSDMRPTIPGLGIPNNEMFLSLNRRDLQWTRDDIDYCRALYDGGILYTDRLLGDFFERIGEKGLLQDPLVILISDHGDGFGEHDFWGHGWTLYEELTHVPILMRFPKDQYAGVRVEDRVSLIDVAPTLFDYLNWKCPPEWQGTSLIPLLEGEKLDPNRVIYSETLPTKQAMFQNSFKIIKNHHRHIDRNRKLVDPIEVFNLEENPKESVNLVHELPRDVTGEVTLMEKALTVMDRERQSEGSVESAELDQGTVEELKALGYLQ